MNRNAVKPIILVLIFIGALFMFSFFTNRVNTDSTTTMGDASLPVMRFVYKDIPINELHGYTQEMDVLSMRDGLVPIDENRTLSLEIFTYGKQLENLRYEIRSIDGKRLLVEEENANVQVSNHKVTCGINLPSLFEANVEYNMQLVVTMGGQDIYYYTRIVDSTDCYVDETLNFATTFHGKTFTPDGDHFIPTYMDPATGDATNLAYVDLSCTLGQIRWADFGGVKLTEPVASFKEITPTYNVIVLNYVVTRVGENDEVEYYNVEEYYRLRQNPTRIYVLNYERTMNQIFRSDTDFLAGDSTILLGIRDKNVEYLANDSGDCIAFVQEGELWVFDRNNNTISQVFSFRGLEGIDERENWDQHDIKIVRVDEAGSISFMVYGYMNKGDHEGKVGVGVYHYDAIAGTIEEEVFIASNKSYEVLKAELGDLMYVNEQKILYIMECDNVYKIDLSTFEVELMIESETSKSYAVSKSGRYLAWIEDEALFSSEVITMMDFKTGIQYEVKSDSNAYLRPLAFLGDDLVYGVAEKANVKVDSVGELVFPMSRIEILNTSEEKLDIIKTYKPRSGYVGDVSLDDNNVYMELLVAQEGRYVFSENDTIMNRETEPVNGVEISTVATDIKQTQVVIKMKPVENPKNYTVENFKLVLLEEDRTIVLPEDSQEYYYVFVKGEVLLATQDASLAVKKANETYGVVVDSNLKYLFKRGRNTQQTPLKNLVVNQADTNASSVTKCVSVILTREGFEIGVTELIGAGQKPATILKNTLTDATVLELRDCTMDELLYFIDQGTPVYAQIGTNQAILLVGYTSSQVYYYDPSAGTTKYTDYDTIEEMFFQGGNYFISYVK